MALDVATAKKWLRVIHDADDELIELAVQGAETEALRFLNLEALPDPLPRDIEIAVMLLVQSSYETAPAEIERMRHAAEVKLFSYREGMGL